MKKLKMDLNGIGELLSKEQMKMVTGGDGYTAGYVTCNYTYMLNGVQVISPPIGHRDANLGASDDCHKFCQDNAPSGVNFFISITCTPEFVTW